MSAVLSRAALLATTALILALTLMPVSGQGDATVSFNISGFRGIADAAANVLLFIPFGALAAMRMRGARRPVLAAAILSVCIELIQLAIPGRFVSPLDVVFNTVGGIAGMTLMRTAHVWLLPGGRLRWLLPAAALAGALTVLVGGAFLFAPAIPEVVLYGQWTADFENMARYEGEVKEAFAGTLPVPSHRIARSALLRRNLLRGDPLSIRLSAGPSTDALAPIFSIYDADEREMLLVGADGSDAVFRFRMRATGARLDQPEIRVRNALAGTQPGSEAEIRVWPRERGYCVEVDQDQTCGLGFTVGETWSLLLYPVPDPARALLPCAWLFALMLPAGFWLRRTVTVAMAGVLTVAVLLVAPRLAGILDTPWSQLSCILMGLAAGHLMGRSAWTASASERIARSVHTPHRTPPPPDRTDP